MLLGEEAQVATSYLAWGVPAFAIGLMARSGVKALRGAGLIEPTIWSSWTLAIVNLVGDLVSLHYGFGAAGLAAAWFVAEVVSSWIPIRAAHRAGLLAMPRFADVVEVTVLSRGKVVASLPEIFAKLFTIQVRECMGREELARLAVIMESVDAGDMIAAQVAKAGSNREMRGDGGLPTAMRWAWRCRLIAVIPVWAIAGWAGALILLGYEFALREYVAQRTARAYRAQARSEGAEQVTRIALYGVLLANGALTANTILTAWVIGNGVYIAVGRYYRALGEEAKET